MIKSTIKDELALKHKTDCLVLFCSDESKLSGDLKELDRKLNSAISAARKDKRFEGKANQTLLLNSRGFLNCDNILLAGIGDKKEVTAEKLRQAVGSSVKLAEQSRFKRISFSLGDGLFDKIQRQAKSDHDAIACAIIEAGLLALYHFDEYKSVEKGKEPHRLGEIVLLLSAKSNASAVRKGLNRGKKLAEAVYLSRDLISHPGNRATPSYLASTAKSIAKKYSLTCKIVGKKEMEKLGMGSLLGVTRGSAEPPALIVLEYKGGKKGEAPIAIVGKGITFDTGGISLKPPASMDEMKMDMSGGAVTLGTMQAVASLKLSINVVGIVPAAENMPSSTAIKPGDILTSMSGKTIEVLNTDAEGRLVLADALSYASRFKPKVIIDLATLTGAVLMALGGTAAAVIGNDNESDLIKQLIASGTETGERLWQLPLWEEHEEAVKSSIADLKNIASKGFGAGTITGAAFLKPFAGDQPWAHLDIAGTSWSGSAKPYIPSGPSGFGVRLLVDYLEKQTQEPKKKGGSK
jgi:leucyl aminopeptidase